MMIMCDFFVTQHDDHDDYDINVNMMIIMIVILMWMWWSQWFCVDQCHAAGSDVTAVTSDVWDALQNSQTENLEKLDLKNVITYYTFLGIGIVV